MRWTTCGITVTLLLALPAAAASPEGGISPKNPPGAPALRSVLIANVPHVRQKPDFCGEACVAMWTAHLGRGDLNQDVVFAMSGLSPELGRGCYTRDLMAAMGRIGFKPGSGGATVAVAQAPAQLDAQFAALHADLLTGVPSILCMHYDDTANSSEHFRLILGYDQATDEAIYHEPASARGAYQRMKRPLLLKLWPLKYSPENWTLIRLRLEGKPQATSGPPITAASRTFKPADYAQHVMELKKKLPSDKFSIVLQPPFVVIGDEDEAMVRRRAAGTVKWAVDLLKAEYFTHDPKEILDIWLFKDEDSYYKNAKRLFGSRPSTPFGYFSDTDRALVMNISTGGGTLVHEIVHPFMAANFPQCPAWFNEGLGSLYEQCGEQDGKICGYTNWRLPHLQKAIAAKKLPTFQKLLAMDSGTFYVGDNYGQSRYLCYYLQQKGLLNKFYHAFHANAAKDPGGYQTLQTVLDNPDMAAFQKQWEAWVLTLRFP